MFLMLSGWIYMHCRIILDAISFCQAIEPYRICHNGIRWSSFVYGNKYGQRNSDLSFILTLVNREGGFYNLEFWTPRLWDHSEHRSCSKTSCTDVSNDFLLATSSLLMGSRKNLLWENTFVPAGRVLLVKEFCLPFLSTTTMGSVGDKRRTSRMIAS